MLHDPARHEPLREIPWNEAAARACIARIVAGLEDEFEPGLGWLEHPRDDPRQPGNRNPSLYYGATGVIWALRYLDGVGAARLRRNDWLGPEALVEQTHQWLGDEAERERCAYLMGETPIRLMEHGLATGPARAACEDELACLIEGNIAHPARELMWGSPGTLLAALLLHRRTGDARWATLFRRTAAQLLGEMKWSAERACWYWQQDLYGSQSTYLDAVHGFVATALPLIAGRDLLADWPTWGERIAGTMRATAVREGQGEGATVTWPVMLEMPAGAADKKLMQYCHGAPGFVICLAGFPDATLDDLLLAAGEATWQAGPLAKGSNLCHGTGGNGYAFLKLYERTGDSRWLDRARAFAMHGITQFEADLAQYGRLRASLWSGDPGFAIYLWDCLRARAAFPTLDVFWA